MKLIIFVPGYLATQTCSFQGDSYLDVYRYALARGFEFAYTPMPNNNYGDRGNATMDDCLDNVVGQYNEICVKRNLGPTDTLILVGHSMGGLVVSRLVTSAYSTKLNRLPDSVRLVNPAIRPIFNWFEGGLGTLLSFVPQSILGLPLIALKVVEGNTLFPGSLSIFPYVKPLLGWSIGRATGAFWVNNQTWGLRPDDGVCDHITIIQCTGDRIVSCEGARAHANRYGIKFVVLSQEYHAYFDAVALAAVFDGL